jgi:hypothetical protein
VSAPLDSIRVEATAETVAGAIELASEQLAHAVPGLDQTAIRFDVLSEGKRGLFGSKPAKVAAVYEPPSRLGNVLEAMHEPDEQGVPANAITFGRVTVTTSGGSPKQAETAAERELDQLAPGFDRSSFHVEPTTSPAVRRFAATGEVDPARLEAFERYAQDDSVSVVTNQRTTSAGSIGSGATMAEAQADAVRQLEALVPDLDRSTVHFYGVSEEMAAKSTAPGPIRVIASVELPLEPVAPAAGADR